MPLRPERWKKGWSTFDLPILPFLAPRVFTPWPSSIQRASVSTQGGLKSYAPAVRKVELAREERTSSAQDPQDTHKLYTPTHDPIAASGAKLVHAEKTGSLPSAQDLPRPPAPTLDRATILGGQIAYEWKTCPTKNAQTVLNPYSLSQDSIVASGNELKGSEKAPVRRVPDNDRPKCTPGAIERKEKKILSEASNKLRTKYEETWGALDLPVDHASLQKHKIVQQRMPNLFKRLELGFKAHRPIKPMRLQRSRAILLGHPDVGCYRPKLKRLSRLRRRFGLRHFQSNTRHTPSIKIKQSGVSSPQVPPSRSLFSRRERARRVYFSHHTSLGNDVLGREYRVRNLRFSHERSRGTGVQSCSRKLEERQGDPPMVSRLVLSRQRRRSVREQRPSVRHPLFLIRRILEPETLEDMEKVAGRTFKDDEEARDYRYQASLKRFKQMLRARDRLANIVANVRKFGGFKHLRAAYVPPKMVRWTTGGSGIGSFDPLGLAWHNWFASLNARYDKIMAGKKYPRPMTWRLLLRRVKLPTTLRLELLAHRDSGSLRTAWEMIPIEKRQRYWLGFMYKVLSNHPDSALKVLMATYHEPYPPDYAVSDCVNYTIAHYFQHPIVQAQEQDGAKIFDIIYHLLRRGPPGQIRLRNDKIGFLIKYLDLAQVKCMYLEFEELGHVFTWDTLIQFASKFANFGEMDLAFEILERLRHKKARFNILRMQQLCSTLLQWKNRPAKDTRSDDEIFKFMLESGLRPNIYHYNILIQNACQRGDHRTAWQIHDMLLQNKISADEYTYSILMNDAKRRLNEDDMRSLQGIVEEKKILNPVIANDLLHATYLLNLHEGGSVQKDGDLSAFEEMLPPYCRYFNIEPLVSLIPNFHEKYPDPFPYSTHPPENAWQPGSDTLIIMITSYLQSCRSPKPISEFYANFRAIIASNSPSSQKLLSTTRIYNAIIMAFGRFPQSVPICTEVVLTMLRDAAATSPSATPSSSSTPPAPSSSIPAPQFSHPQPDVRTWSTLLNIFMKHHQPRAAERVLQHMEARHISPNVVTWTSLVGGYAALQDPGKTVDVLARMEEKGLAPNEATMTMLGRIKDKRMLIELMRQKEARQALAVEEKAKEGKDGAMVVGMIVEKVGHISRDLLAPQA